MLEASIFIGFVVLAIACLALLGLPGIVAWILVYGLFRFVSARLLLHIGED